MGNAAIRQPRAVSSTRPKSGCHRRAINAVADPNADPNQRGPFPFDNPLRTGTDEENTIEEAPPTIPEDVPSPLGDEEAERSDGPSQEDVGVPASKKRVSEAAALAGTPGRILSRTASLAPESAIVRRQLRVALPEAGSLRPHVSPDEARAVRDARAAARHARARTRLIVLAIWGAAVVIGGVLGFIALAS